MSKGELVTSHLAKSYGKRTVVKDVSLRVSQGEIVGLLGPNGAGKTTSFYMIVGLVPTDKGSIHLHQQDITHLAIHERARLGLGYLPQEASIFRKLTVAQNILAVLELRPDLTRTMQKEMLEQLLQEFRIQHVRDTLGISLSGGERRRVEIARAIATNPQFMLLDEPFAGIDPLAVNDIKIMIYALQQRNMGILITDHNVRETLSICQRAYIVSDGTILCDGIPDEILSNQRVREVYLGEHFEL